MEPPPRAVARTSFDPMPWLERIAAEQAAEGDPFFRPGLFASYRRPPGPVSPRPDDNVFYSASIAWLLLQNEPFWPEAARRRSQSLRARVANRYGDYRSRDRLPLFNFWRNDPPTPFPHGRWMHRVHRFVLPDDLDDTALVYLTSPEPPGDPAWMHQQAARHANGVRSWSRSGLPAFRRLETYSVWFGVNMPVEFDACVLANFLYWVSLEGLPLQAEDRNALFFLEQVLAREEHRKRPLRVAPYYAHPAIVLYHLARLYGRFALPNRGRVEPLLVAAVEGEAERGHGPMYRLLLSTARMRLGGKPLLAAPLALDELPRHFPGWECFEWFAAPLLAHCSHPLLYRIAPWRGSFFVHTCPAFSLMLMLEHETLRCRAAACV
jgi:hypothetical protein